MAISIQSVFTLKAGENNFVRNLLDRDNVKRTEDYDSAVAGSSRVAPNNGEVVIGLSGFTAGKHLLVESSGEVDVVINTTNTIKVKPSTGQNGRLWLDGASITALKIVNPTTATVAVQWLLAGT